MVSRRIQIFETLPKSKHHDDIEILSDPVESELADNGKWNVVIRVLVSHGELAIQSSSTDRRCQKVAYRPGVHEHIHKFCALLHIKVSPYP
jgi:hypothetical protein